MLVMASGLKLPTNPQDTDFRAVKAVRRATRQRQYQALSGAVAEATETFTSRNAHVWANPRKHDTQRRIHGHPGLAASMYVSENMAEFHIKGSAQAHFASMHRTGGKGAHEITDGVIIVDVELRPRQGMNRVVEIPVTVKNGYLQQPVVMYHQGTPMIISQSALDDIMEGSEIDQSVKTDRPHMYAPPGTGSGRGHQNLSYFASGEMLTREHNREKEYYSKGKSEGDETEAKNKARRKMKRDLSKFNEPSQFEKEIQEFEPNYHTALHHVADTLEPGEHLDVTKANRDCDHLDVMERDRSDMLRLGQMVRLSEEVEVRYRGGGHDYVPKGTRGWLCRDIDGAGELFAMKLEDGSEIIVCADVLS